MSGTPFTASKPGRSDKERGIAFDGDEICIAASDEIFVFDRAFTIERSI